MKTNTPIVFTSKKDLFFTVLYYLIIALLATTLSLMIATKEQLLMPDFFGLIGLVIFMAVLSWFFWSMKYELTTEEFIYKTGPIKGKVKIDTISEISIGKTKWTGVRVATAKKGLIVKYNGFSEIYISPDSNKTFINAILKLNSKIKISE